jgi:hypothetical protein
MLQLVKDVKRSVSGDLSMEWLKPFMTERKCKAGEMPLTDLSGSIAEARAALTPGAILSPWTTTPAAWRNL